mgnify:CR=1 FL=1
MSKSVYLVNVYGDEYHEEVVARVRYNDKLDFWDGRNFTCGSVGRHKGITKLKDGRYVIIYGTQWQGERDYAEIVTDEEALQEILRSRNTELLSSEKFSSLKELYDKQMVSEEEDSEE